LIKNGFTAIDCSQAEKTNLEKAQVLLLLLYNGSITRRPSNIDEGSFCSSSILIYDK